MPSPIDSNRGVNFEFFKKKLDFFRKSEYKINLLALIKGEC